MVEKQTCQELIKEKNNISVKLQEIEGINKIITIISFIKNYDSVRLIIITLHVDTCNKLF